MIAGVASIKVDTEHVDMIAKVLRDAGPKRLLQVFTTTINLTLKGIKTDILKSDGPILSRFPVKRKDLAPWFVIKKATARENEGRISFSKSNRLSLRNFQPERYQDGITYIIDGKKGRQMLPKAFGGPNRTGKIKWVAIRPTKKRLPLAFPKGLSPWGMFNKAEAWKTVHASAEERFRKNMTHALKFHIGVIDKTIKRRTRDGIVVRGGHDF
jgi:hypothetical protein